MPDADLLGRSAWVWPQSYWREGESAWLTAHKFGFLNGLDKVALGRALASLDPTGQQVAKSAPRHLLRRIASERRLRLRPGARDDTLRAFTLEELFAEHRDKVVHPFVRFCPACIAQWFHASIFQLAGVRRCPVHQLALQAGCPACGHAIQEAFDPRSFAHPLHCGRCGAPFSGRQPLFCEVFGRTQTAPARLAASIQGELQELCHTTRVQGVAGEYPKPSAAHLEVLLAGTRIRKRLGCAADGQWLQFQMHDINPWMVKLRISGHRGRPFQPIVDGISDERGRCFRLIVDDVSA